MTHILTSISHFGQVLWIVVSNLMAFLVVPGLLYALASQKQFTDLARRELRDWRLPVLMLLAGLLQLSTQIQLIRVLQIALFRLSSAHWWITFCVAITGAAYGACHHAVATHLYSDKFKLENSVAIAIWRVSGYVGCVAGTGIAVALRPWLLAHNNLGQSTRMSGAEIFLALLPAVLYVAGALTAANPKGLKRLARIGASTNIIFAHLLLLMVNILVVGYAQWASAKLGFPLLGVLIFAALLLIVAFSKALKDLPWTAREVPSKTWTAPVETLSPKPEEDLLFFCCEGGGIHAAYRALAVLSELDLRTGGKFWDALTATSTVSGGSVGTAAYRCLREALSDPKARSRRASDVGRADLLLPSLIRLFLTEPIILVFRTGRNLDRSKGLSLAVEMALESAMNSEGKQPTPSNIGRQWLSDVSKSGPVHFFNTASVNTGGRFVLGTRKLENVSSNLDAQTPADVELVKACTLSARFPIVSSSGLLYLGQRVVGESPELRYERMVDGGIYDNSGVDTILSLIRDRQSNGHTGKTRVVVVSTTYTDQASQKTPPGNACTRLLDSVLSLAYTGLSSLLGRNQESVAELERLASLGGRIEVAKFGYDFDAINAPLAWFLDGSRARASSFMMGATYGFFRDSEAPVEFEGLSQQKAEDNTFLRGKLEIVEGPLGEKALADMWAVREANKSAIQKVCGWLSVEEHESLTRLNSSGLPESQD